MVRNLVGSLILVGRGEQPERWIGEVLARRDRTVAGPTAPPEGLVFLGPLYPASFGLPEKSRPRPRHEHAAAAHAHQVLRDDEARGRRRGRGARRRRDRDDLRAAEPEAPRHRAGRRDRAALPALVSKVALFADPDPAEVQAVLESIRPELLQFHGSETAEFCGSFGRHI
jgi:hypothetical protein